MSHPVPAPGEPVDQLLAAINAKLKAKRAVLAESLSYGRLSWRQRSNGEIEVDLEPKL